MRSNSGRLGIDPNRIAAGGGSAGGHLAAATGAIDGLEEPGENARISSRPNALVLFNPALVLAPAPEDGLDQTAFAKLAERAGPEPERVSPYHHVKKGAPPAKATKARPTASSTTAEPTTSTSKRPSSAQTNSWSPLAI